MESKEIENIEVKEVQAVNPRTVSKPYSEETIEAYAGKCGGVRNLREIPIYTDDGYEFWYLVKKPSKNVLQAIAYEKEKGDKKNDPNAINEIQKIMMGCILEGDKDAYEHDGSIYTALCKEIGKLASGSSSTLKNS